MKVHVPLPPLRGRDDSYDVLIDRGLLGRLPSLLTPVCPAATYAVISDSNVGPRYGAALVSRLAEGGRPAQLFTFAAGETSKTRETWAKLSDQLLAAHVGRDGAVIAVGGGVVGDVAGFVAATYLRGIPWVQVPTTLVAMIDASLGGKTGVDVSLGKNLVGAFHQPRLVIADLEALMTLPAPHFTSGMAEAIKHGVIADAEYFDDLEREERAIRAREAAALERLVARSVAIKAAVVAADERETGRRAVLNFGHTIGHALEAASGFALMHGEAVSIGMVLEARLAELAGLAAAGTASRIAQVATLYGLPVDLPGSLGLEEILSALGRDKKVRDGVVRFALPRRIGEMAGEEHSGWTVPVADSLLRSVLSRGVIS